MTYNSYDCFMILVGIKYFQVNSSCKQCVRMLTVLQHNEGNKLKINNWQRKFPIPCPILDGQAHYRITIDKIPPTTVHTLVKRVTAQLHVSLMKVKTTTSFEQSFVGTYNAVQETASTFLMPFISLHRFIRSSTHELIP